MTITIKDIEKDINKDIDSKSLMELLNNDKTPREVRQAQNVCLPTAIKGLSIYPSYPTVDLMDADLIPTIDINREYMSRVNKQLPNFVKDTIGLKVFTVIKVTKKITIKLPGEDITVQPGTYLADGNTRREAHNTGRIDLPFYVLVLEISIDNAKQYLEEYYGIDNTSSAEKTPEMIRGAIRANGLVVKTKVAQNGNFASALNNAYPGDKRDNAITKISFFKREIELLDKCRVFLPTDNALKHQHFYGACLVAAKLYAEPGTTALQFEQVLMQLTALDSETMSTAGDKWNGITALLYQCANPHRKNWISEEHLGKTNFASVEPSYNFYLYCFEMAMSDKMLNRTKGFKRTNWEGYYKDAIESIK